MLKNSIIVSILSLLVSIATFINQVIIASHFGAGALMDIYLSASSFPLLISGLIIASLSYSLTPFLIKMHLEIGDDKLKIFASKMFFSLSKYALIIYVILAAFQALILKWMFPAITNENFDSALSINLLSWLSVYFLTLLAFLSAYFNTLKSFTFPLLLAFLPYLGSICIIILLSDKISITAVPAGLAVGSFLALVIAYFRLFNKIDKGNLEVANAYRKIQQYFRRIPMVCLAMLCFSVYQSIDAYWAPQTGGAALSYLGYCQRILIAIGSLVIVGPSTVLIPRLTKAIAEKRETDFLNDAAMVIKIVIALASLIAVIGSVSGEHIIRILFERGAFTSVDTLGIYSILPYMLTGMTFMLSVVVLFRVFFVKDMIRIVIGLGIVSAILYFTASGIGSLVFGIKGIAMAYILTWITVFGTSLYFIFKNNFEIFFNKQTNLFLIKQVICLILVGTITYFLQKVIDENIPDISFYNSLIAVACCGTVGVALYFLLTIKLVRQNEILVLLSPILNSIKKSEPPDLSE